MQYGFVLPFSDARFTADLAAEAEQAGWDGIFVFESVWGVDAWVQLAAAAMVTKRIRLGTLLSPLSRMRPWDLAGKAVALDHLSNGRVTLSVGLGAPDTGFAEFGEITDRKTRAELLDEGLEIMTGLWRGQPFQFEGKHYHLRPTQFPAPPPPVQQPRLPIWVVGAWPSEKSMQRVLKYDGLLPQAMGENGARQATPAEVSQMNTYIRAKRTHPTPFDIIVEGTTPGDRRQTQATMAAWAEVGATWWIEAMWSAPNTNEGRKAVLKRLRQGPPLL